MAIEFTKTDFTADKPCRYRLLRVAGFDVAIVMYGDALVRLAFGGEEISEQIADEFVLAKENKRLCPDLVKQIKVYFKGEKIEFDCKIDLWWAGGFAQSVLRNCAKVGYGQTLSYGELAKKAGSEKAARAVGSAMANNRVPIIIPCHRIVRSDGALGQYSAADGVVTKERLLVMECGR